MPRDDTYLVDILESAKIALAYVQNRSWDEFHEDIQCQDAVIRRIEIIGEAARDFPGDAWDISAITLARNDFHAKPGYPRI